MIPLSTSFAWRVPGSVDRNFIVYRDFHPIAIK
jgi:hypothetical protein